MCCRTSCFAGPARNGLALPIVEAVRLGQLMVKLGLSPGMADPLYL
jgi:hypothetical protein